MQAEKIALRVAALLDENFADMNSDAVEHGVPGLTREFADAALDEQRELRGVARLGKNAKERIARGADFLGLGHLRENFADDCVMAFEHFDGVTAWLSQRKEPR